MRDFDEHVATIVPTARSSISCAAAPISSIDCGGARTRLPGIESQYCQFAQVTQLAKSFSPFSVDQTASQGLQFPYTSKERSARLRSVMSTLTVAQPTTERESGR